VRRWPRQTFKKHLNCTGGGIRHLSTFFFLPRIFTTSYNNKPCFHPFPGQCKWISTRRADWLTCWFVNLTQLLWTFAAVAYCFVISPQTNVAFIAELFACYFWPDSMSDVICFIICTFSPLHFFDCIFHSQLMFQFYSAAS